MRPVARCRQAMCVAFKRRRDAIKQVSHTWILNRRGEVNLFQPSRDRQRVAHPGLAEIRELGVLRQVNPAVAHQTDLQEQMAGLSVNEAPVEATMAPSNVPSEEARTSEETIMDMLREIRNELRAIRECQERQGYSKK